MRELDLVPSLAARALRRKPSRSIACVFSVGAQPCDDVSGLMQETYRGLVLQTFAHVTDQHGYTLIHRRRRREDPDGPSRITSLVSEARVDGIVVFADRRDDPLIALLQARRFPFVVFGLDGPGTHFAMRAKRDGRRLSTGGERFRGYEAVADAGRAATRWSSPVHSLAVFRAPPGVVGPAGQPGPGRTTPC